jgi:hypothetical protein
MMGPILFAAVIGTLHLESDILPAGGDYVVVPFTVPAGTVEFDIVRTTTPSTAILDFGVWDQAAAWRGWSGGLTDPTTIGVADSTRGYMPGPITAGDWQLVIGKAKLGGATAHYTADLTFKDAATLTPRTRAAWQPTVVATGQRWYSGDLHVHSHESGDAPATFDQIFALAQSRQLDFVVMSDHNTVSQQSLVAALQPTLTNLLIVRGIEVTTYAGHGGAIGASVYVDHRIGLNSRDVTGLIADVNAQGGVFVVNHPVLDLGTACIGCAWKEVNTPWDQIAGIELQTGDYDTGLALFTKNAVALWDTQLDAGAQLAAAGGSDDHRAGINEGTPPSQIGTPTTRVFADELSEPAIVAAIKAGRTQVALRGPDDPLIDLTTRGPMPLTIGDTLTAHRADLTAHVAGGAGLALVIVVNGAEATRASVDGADWSHDFSVDVPATGGRVRAELRDGLDQPVVITSHLWLTYAPGGCSVAQTQSPAASWLFLASLAAILLRVSARRSSPPCDTCRHRSPDAPCRVGAPLAAQRPNSRCLAATTRR